MPETREQVLARLNNQNAQQKETREQVLARLNSGSSANNTQQPTRFKSGDEALSYLQGQQLLRSTPTPTKTPLELAMMDPMEKFKYSTQSVSHPASNPMSLLGQAPLMDKSNTSNYTEFNNDVKRQQNAGDKPMFGMLSQDKLDAKNAVEDFYKLQDAISRNVMGKPEAGKISSELYNKVNEYASSPDLVGMKNYVKTLNDKGLIPENIKHYYENIVNIGDSYDPAVRAERQKKIDEIKKESDMVANQNKLVGNDAKIVKDKINKLRGLSAMNASMGNTPFTENEQAIIADSIKKEYEKLYTLQSKITASQKSVQSKTGDKYAGLTPEEASKKKAEDAVVSKYDNEWTGLLKTLGLNPTSEELNKAKNISFNGKDATDIKQSIGDYLHQLEHLSPTAYIEAMGKDQNDIQKEWAYKYFWPKFKQAVANYDPGKLSQLIDSIDKGIDGDYHTSADAGRIQKFMDEAGSLPQKNGESIDDSEMRSLLRQAVLVNYMNVKGKDVSEFFGNDNPETGGLIAGRNSKGDIVEGGLSKSLLGGAAEFAGGIENLVGMEYGTRAKTIQDDLNTHNTVIGDFKNIIDQSGANIPTNLQEWTKPTTFDRVTSFGEDAAKIMGEFATVDLALLKGAKFLRGAEALSKGTKLIGLGAKTTERFTALADETALMVKGLDTVAKTATNPLARALAKVTLGGGNMLSAAAKYELVNQAFGDEAVTFTSGAAGSLAKGVLKSSPIGKIFSMLPDNPIAKQAYDFFAKGLGEVGKLGSEQISIQGLDNFLEGMKDDTERNWFLGTTFLMGALMGGKSSNMQEWALKHRSSMSPESRQNFDIMTQRAEIGKIVKGEVQTLDKTDFNNLMANRLNGSVEQQAAWNEQAATHTEKTIADIYGTKYMNDTRLPISDSQKQAIHEENYNRIRRGDAPMNKAQVADLLISRKSAKDVSTEYNDNMSQEERMAKIDQHIGESASQNLEGVWSNIKKIEDPALRDSYNERFKVAQDRRARKMELIKSRLTEETPVDSVGNIKKVNDIVASLEGETGFRKAGSGFERLFMDESARLRKLYEQSGKAGLKISEATDAYFQQSLAQGKASFKSQQAVENFGKIAEGMHKDGINAEKFGEYLYAKSALEKNVEIERRMREEAGSLTGKRREDAIKDMNELHSGMTNEKAESVIKEINDSGSADKYAKYEAEYRKQIIDPILEEKLNEGIITPKEYEMLTSTYEYYVPTKIDPEKVGIAPASVRNASAKTGMIGKGIQALRGGRTTHETRVNPFFQGISDNIATHMLVERNNVNKSLKGFIEENGLSGTDKDLFQVTPARYVDGKEINADPANAISVRDGGKKYYIKINNAKILNAVKGTMRDSDLGSIMKPLNRLTSWKRSVETSLNPAFIPKNMIRDLGFSYARLEQMGIGKEGRQQFFGNVKKAWKGVRDSQKGVNSEWAMHLKDLQQHGGASTHNDFVRAETRVKDLQDSWKKMTQDKSMTESAMASLKKKTVDVISDLNQAAEMSVRLASYKSALDSGMSKEAAAMVAKEITVNFDRKGQWSHISNSLFMFSNAQLQGTKNVVKLIAESPRGRMFAASLAGAALTVAGINELLGSQEEIDGITEFDKQNSLTIINPFTSKKGDYIRIPVPQGLDSFKYMGDMLYDVMKGDKSVGDISKNWLTNAISSVSPLSGPSMGQIASPTFLDPVVQHLYNENYYGGNLYPDQNGKEGGTVMSQEFQGHPSIASQKVAEFLNYATGGSKQTKGYVDWSPNVWDNYFKWIEGGAGQFISNTLTLAYSGAQGDMGDIATKDIPIYSAFARDGDALGTYKSDLYKWREVSSATKISEADMDKIVNTSSRLVEAGSLAPDKAAKLMGEIQKNQWLIKLAEQNDMTVPEVQDQLKTK